MIQGYSGLALSLWIRSIDSLRYVQHKVLHLAPNNRADFTWKVNRIKAEVHSTGAVTVGERGGLALDKYSIALPEPS